MESKHEDDELGERRTGDDPGEDVEGLSVTRVGPRATCVVVHGKLRGSRARALGHKLADLAQEGVVRTVLDLREVHSLDSLGTFALEEGLERGLKIHLVVRPSFEFDGFFTSRTSGRRALRVHHSLDEALSRVRQVIDSGLCLV